MRKLHPLLWHCRTERNLGYLTLRLFTGAAMLTHGLPKLQAGPERWRQLGTTVTAIGFPGPEVAWGFMAAFAESIGAALLFLGLFTPAASFLIACTMLVAAVVAHRGDPFAMRELAMLYFFTCLMFMVKGAGDYSVDRFLPRDR